MKIAVCQMNTTIADFQGNVAKVGKAIAWAKKRGATLAVFPEMVTFGYPPRDLLDKSYLIDQNREAAREIAKKTTHNFGVVFGTVSRNALPRGRGLFNIAAIAYEGKIQQEQPKTLLPTYDVFDEARHFDAATVQQPHRFQGVSLGLTVCEDIWSDFDFEGRKYYPLDPPSLLVGRGAHLLINIAASPFVLGKQEVRRKLLKETALNNRVPLVYCNLVGGNDELVFDGQSMVVNEKGEILCEGKRFQEDYFLVDLANAPVKRGSVLKEIEEIEAALLLGLRDYFRKCRFSKALIGLSGGIDSSVVAALAVKALGNKNVMGVAMPSPYSSEESLRDAKALAKNLKISLQVIPIENIYRDYLQGLRIDLHRGVPIEAENIQARIRGTILMTISNKTKALVLSTGNKSELSVGYCTLYGDMAGGLALISDVPKTAVYALAHHLNRPRKVIPDSVLQKAPSAELRPNQKDEDSLPPYSTLDAILKRYIEEHRSLSQIVAEGFDRKVVQEMIRRVDANEYKRRQAAPGIKVTSKAFGIGRRFPMAWKF